MYATVTSFVEIEKLFSCKSHSSNNITYVVCVNFIHEWRKLQFKVNFKRQIF